jgi:secondary thiamine-phosphate synthase enzyme
MRCLTNLTNRGFFRRRNTVWIQHEINVSPRPRGFHLITREILAALPELESTRTGLLHLFLRHTSASLAINENADPDVPEDLEMAINHVVPESLPYSHTLEGPDDSPAHLKASLLGCSLTVPISDGRLLLGTWQGVYLCEHRNYAGRRTIIATIHGE